MCHLPIHNLRESLKLFRNCFNLCNRADNDTFFLSYSVMFLIEVVIQIEPYQLIDQGRVLASQFSSSSLYQMN